jgi:hypothetical protein
MNDISTSTQPPGAETEQATGHGRHRGPVSAQEPETQPRGRHRRDGEESSGRTAA